MRNIIIAGFIMLGTLGAQAEVVPFNVFLSSTNYPSPPDTHFIPHGKIFIIEGVLLSANQPNPTNTEIRVSVSADNLTFSSNMSIPVSDTYTNGKYVWLPKPFRLKGGEWLRTPNNAIYTACRYFGLMIDEADLYAQGIPSELENVETSGGQLLANVKFGSARPRITTIESAVDINDFLSDATGVEIAGLNRDESVVTVDQDGEDRKFLRVRSVARN